jgi:predicted secreted protein
MSQVCRKCSHANPPEAVYCYFDGVILGGPAANGSPIRAGAKPFPNPFVFPSGQVCNNFDQLATACQQNWSVAVALLQQGFLGSFLGGIGRADLAQAAQEAAHFPDVDRGLDQLLAKLPTQVLDAPKLRVEPTDIHLGILDFGTNRDFELHLANHGLRLVYGSVSSDCKWLTLGEAPGHPQRLFQFASEAVLTVQIRGQYLRAGQKTLEGRLVVESNGGTAAVTVRTDVPIKPYVGGVLAGATTPRQIAEKARAFPKEAALLFESGAVAKWFAGNGWTYPVQGPAASGVGAVQQFFEALGLSKPPKVEISHTALAFRGHVGEALEATVELKSEEKRPIYAHAVCDQPWLDVSEHAIRIGRNAAIQVVIARVPRRPGETLQANVIVVANGNQKFNVPVSLAIDGVAGNHPEPVSWISPEPAAVPLVTAFPLPIAGTGVVGGAALSASGIKGQKSEVRSQKSEVRGPAAVAIPTALAAGTAAPPVRSVSAESAVLTAAAAPLPAKGNRSPGPGPRSSALKSTLHAIPALVLAFLLLLVLVWDVFFAHSPGDDVALDPRPRIAVAFDDDGLDDNGKPNTRSMKFGLTTVPLNPKLPAKKLTYDRRGKTNSTVIRINGQNRAFGFENRGETQWLTLAEQFADGKGTKSVWLYTDKSRASLRVQVTQSVEIVAGEPIEDNQGKHRRFLDTCRIRYTVENKGTEIADVGVSVLIDTLIGEDNSNDGVPFTVPGMSGLVSTSANFESPRDRIPDFLQVLEVPNLKNPGIVGFMNFKLGGGVEPPSRVLLTHWIPRVDQWDVPVRPIAGDDNPDSAVVVYWGEKPLRPGEKRELGFAYGLGSLSISGGQLGVSVGGSFAPNGDLTVVALVNNPEKGQTVTLKLPEGFQLVEGDATQSVPISRAGSATQQSPVTWRIRAVREGTFTIEVQSSNRISQKKRITIKAKTIF